MNRPFWMDKSLKRLFEECDKKFKGWDEYNHVISYNDEVEQDEYYTWSYEDVVGPCENCKEDILIGFPCYITSEFKSVEIDGISKTLKEKFGGKEYFCSKTCCVKTKEKRLELFTKFAIEKLHKEIIDES